jgi:hypothetical protein
MRYVLVIALPQVIDDFQGMKNIAEPVLIKACIPKAAFKTLNRSILG